jgi:hypothetical protein
MLWSSDFLRACGGVLFVDEFGREERSDYGNLLIFHLRSVLG